MDSCLAHKAELAALLAKSDGIPVGCYGGLNERKGYDEYVLIGFSGNEEKHLRISHISKMISGQRTPIFERYPQPKEYQLFSLTYNDRSLDLICKDKDEADLRFSSLKALISRINHRKWRAKSRRG